MKIGIALVWASLLACWPGLGCVGIVEVYENEGEFTVTFAAADSTCEGVRIVQGNIDSYSLPDEFSSIPIALRGCLDFGISDIVWARPWRRHYEPTPVFAEFMIHRRF